MKLNISLISFAVQFAGVLAAQSASEIAALELECGDLGVMEVPEGADLSTVRHCAGHPNGPERVFDEDSTMASLDHPRSDVAQIKSGAHLFARKCYDGAPYGCDKGYCWKICGDNGQWCWTAYGNDGKGDWRSCTNWSQCSDSQDHKCGQGCKSGSNDCGCSC